MISLWFCNRTIPLTLCNISIIYYLLIDRLYVQYVCTFYVFGCKCNEIYDIFISNVYSFTLFLRWWLFFQKKYFLANKIYWLASYYQLFYMTRNIYWLLYPFLTVRPYKVDRLWRQNNDFEKIWRERFNYFIYRRPTLYPLEIAVDFLKSL